MRTLAPAAVCACAHTRTDPGGGESVAMRDGDRDRDSQTEFAGRKSRDILTRKRRHSRSSAPTASPSPSLCCVFAPGGTRGPDGWEGKHGRAGRDGRAGQTRRPIRGVSFRSSPDRADKTELLRNLLGIGECSGSIIWRSYNCYPAARGDCCKHPVSSLAVFSRFGLFGRFGGVGRFCRFGRFVRHSPVKSQARTLRTSSASSTRRGTRGFASATCMSALVFAAPASSTPGGPAIFRARLHTD